MVVLFDRCVVVGLGFVVLVLFAWVLVGLLIAVGDCVCALGKSVLGLAIDCYVLLVYCGLFLDLFNVVLRVSCGLVWVAYV